MTEEDKIIAEAFGWFKKAYEEKNWDHLQHGWEMVMGEKIPEPEPPKSRIEGIRDAVNQDEQTEVVEEEGESVNISNDTGPAESENVDPVKLNKIEIDVKDNDLTETEGKRSGPMAKRFGSETPVFVSAKSLEPLKERNNKTAVPKQPRPKQPDELERFRKSSSGIHYSDHRPSD